MSARLWSVGEAEPSCHLTDQFSRVGGGLPTAVIYSGHSAVPRTTGIAGTADTKQASATSMTVTPNSSLAQAPRPGLPSGFRVT